MLTYSIREVFRTNLGVKKTERVLVFTDRPTKKDRVSEEDLLRWNKLRDIAMLTVETGRGFAKDVLYHCYPSRGSHGKEPPETVWRLAFGDRAVDALKKEKLLKPIVMKKISEERLKRAETIIKRHCRKAVDVVIALSNYSTSHTRFRDFLTNICGTRYASMPLFDVAMFEGAMNVDWRALERRSKALAGVLRRATEVRITTPNGTEVRVSKKGRRVFVDSGNLRHKGSFGNLPAGEVFFAPVEGTAEGRMVLEWAPTRRLLSPVTLIISQGEVQEIQGEEPFVEALRDKLMERSENRNIAEIGFGTNDRARRPDNILESEKILGTVHIALGDNSSFGGKVKTPFHQDFVFFKPTVTLRFRSGETLKIIEEGKMMIEK
jgi:leucyl aminopeptidase (aminopeptidase T)